MKARISFKRVQAAATMVAGLTLLVSFQNCGKAGFDAALDDSVDAASTDAILNAKYGSSMASKIQDIPFAFETSFDTITYNSCAGGNLPNKPGFFTLKAGAYATSGIRLNPEFFTYADQNFSPVYPAKTLSDTQYKEYLSDSPANSEAIPTMAIRTKNSLTDVVVCKGCSAVTVGKDVIPLVGTLTDPLIVDSFIKKNVTANYFPFSQEKRIIEGEFSFNSNEDEAEKFRLGLMNFANLTITYLPKASEAYKVRSPSSSYPVKQAYGKAYSFTFTPESSIGAASTNPSRVIYDITESDLSSTASSTFKTWDCSRHFKIVRSQEAAAYCPPHTQAELTPAVRAKLEVARRHLRADQWDVNVTRQCVVPKGSLSCYSETAVGGAPIVEYDLTKECYSGLNTTGSQTANSQCMHFVTICTRD